MRRGSYGRSTQNKSGYDLEERLEGLEEASLLREQQQQQQQ